jgi:hypothetical protein
MPDMPKISVQFTPEELQALLTMSENQIFRQKFVDPKFPGHKSQPNYLQAAESAMGVLKSALGKEKGFMVTVKLNPVHLS